MSQNVPLTAIDFVFYRLCSEMIGSTRTPGWAEALPGRDSGDQCFFRNRGRWSGFKKSAAMETVPKMSQ
jgi:hypothetical protein